MLNFDVTPADGLGAGGVAGVADGVTVTTADGGARLTLCGELDAAMVPGVRTPLAGVDGDIELDCAGLTFMDSAGVNLFVELHNDCVGRGAKLTILNAPRCVTRLLELTGVDGLFDVRPEDAVA